jgi:sugar lactone lactonase YvrE
MLEMRVPVRRVLLPTIFVGALGAAGCGDGVMPTSPAPPPPPSPPPAAAAGLWTVSGDPAGIVRLAPTQLSGSGARAPATTITTPSAGLNTLASVAFDRNGTLWVTSADESLLLGFAPTDLVTSGSHAAATVIQSVAGSLQSPLALAFDATGRLWVANQDGGTLVRFDGPQLAAGGPVAPAVVVAGAGHPAAIAFDANGSMWVADNQAQTLSRYDRPQLSSSGAPRPPVVLTGVNASLASPSGLAFDAFGTLWVANLGNRSVVGYDPAQLAASGSPTPRVVLRAADGSLALPVGLAFDAEGSLWVAGAGGTLTSFDRASLGTTGTTTVSGQERLTVAQRSILWSVAFWPRPAGLPIDRPDPGRG